MKIKRNNMRLLSRRSLSHCAGMALSWVLPYSTLGQGESGIDLSISPLDRGGGTVLTWYPSATGADRYAVTIYDANGNSLTNLSFPGDTRSCQIENAADQNSAISVAAYDARGTLLATSPRESLRPLPANLEPLAALESAAVPPACGWTLELVQADAANFPFLYVTVRALSNGLPLGTLQKTNFQVYEEGRLQTDFFDVTLPDETNSTRLADIVFLIDTSGSMQEEINAVANNARAFADGLVARGIDYRLALVQFGQSANNGAPRIILPLTSDANAFKNAVGALVAGGGTEPGFGAVDLAIQQLNFRPGTQKAFILITDEDSDGGNREATVNRCVANNITVHAAVSCSFGASQEHYCNANSLRARTGGLLFSVTQDLTPIFETIVERLGDTYIVRYRTDNPIADGRERCGLVVATNEACRAEVPFCYTPGGAPIITRTLQTLLLHQQPLLANSSPQICVQVRDNAFPYVSNVTLFVRTSNPSNAYTQITMPPNAGGHPSNNVYCATVPAQFVRPPGLDYYIRATDGQVTSSAPGTEPALLPYQLAVLPNLVPEILHTPPAFGRAGIELPLPVEARDNTFRMASLALFYRPQGALLWNTNLVLYGTPGRTSVTEVLTVPAGRVIPPVLEYYFRAVDDFGLTGVWPEGGADRPYELPIITNQSPIANAGPDQTNECGLAPIVLDASASSDPDTNDVLQFAWWRSGVLLGTNEILSGVPLPLGSNYIVLEVYDDDFATNTDAVIVYVIDTTPPAIVCPTNIVRNADASRCATAVSFTASATDLCSAPAVVCVPPSGSDFPGGTTVVNCRATDGVGLTNNCSFTVTVVDATPPTIVCPTDIVRNADANRCSVSVAYSATFVDNCPGGQTSCTPTSGSEFRNGTTPVSCTAVDARGNQTHCTFNVTVVDVTPPVLRCPADIVFDCAPSNNVAVNFTVSAADNCDAAVITLCSPAPGSLFAVGETTVTCTAMDDAENVARCTFKVTVRSGPIANAQVLQTDEDLPLPILLTAQPAEPALSFAIVSPPAHGTLTGTPPNVTYVPEPDYCGPDEFIFEVTKGQCNPSRATVRIDLHGIQDCPVATAQTFTTFEDVAAQLTLTGNDPDAVCESASLAYTIVATPAHGILSGTPPNLTYTPDADYCGPDHIVFTVSDGVCESAPETNNIQVVCVNDCPIPALRIAQEADLCVASGALIIISPNNLSACLTLDGSLSHDVDSESLTHFWYADADGDGYPDPSPIGAASMATSCFPTGMVQVWLVVSDGQCEADISVTVDVITPADAVEGLIAKVDAADIGSRNKRPLIATLKAAMASFERGSFLSALNQLEAFIHKAGAQIGRTYPGLAADWTCTAQGIIQAFQATDSVTPRGP